MSARTPARGGADAADAAIGVARGLRGSRQRGERTRESIVRATLRVIAAQGVGGVTHRAVAREARVNLSLTTYYFVDLYDLLAAAFRDLMQRSQAELGLRWSQVLPRIKRDAAAALRTRKGRAQLRDALARQFVDFLHHKILHNRVDLAAEHHFLFEGLVDPRLSELAELHRARLAAPIVRMCRLLGSDAPTLDADLLLGTAMRLEYEALLVPPERYDVPRLRRAIRRVLGWILKLS
ncbi:MAG TPA: TetR family transcriptional regulator [Pseudomonadota bacterium]|nr:TetR family transcriptional regulator [Xanthomonadales bacterium]MBP7417666.1 TetR family transcriptional regulator [Xanthomonadales bacterium]HQX25832.1 TetR family transcriptional regulator [Pseudomonadota bacterium]HQY35637.1 TetR family transcriptional regulator [Pseudomonadota bacterium]HRA38199.1 TetR family transcriptional regulator [Pseudomonadota bacterium]